MGISQLPSWRKSATQPTATTRVVEERRWERPARTPFPGCLWWRHSDQVPYPTPIEGRNRAYSISGSLTHVFSPSMTNETVVAYTLVKLPNVFSNPKTGDRGNVGYGVQGLFKNGVAQ